MFVSYVIVDDDNFSPILNEKLNQYFGTHKGPDDYLKNIFAESINLFQQGITDQKIHSHTKNFSITKVNYM